eukprot:Hpha_TRINITY_DN15018_c6_g1::TRINITY_DN15018_c6_g1_i1::g.124736::m.124736
MANASGGERQRTGSLVSRLLAENDLPLTPKESETCAGVKLRPPSSASCTDFALSPDQKVQTDPDGCSNESDISMPLPAAARVLNFDGLSPILFPALPPTIQNDERAREGESAMTVSDIEPLGSPLEKKGTEAFDEEDEEEEDEEDEENEEDEEEEESDEEEWRNAFTSPPNFQTQELEKWMLRGRLHGLRDKTAEPVHDYEVHRELGEGNTGQVYKVRRRADGCLFAMKAIMRKHSP